MASLGMIGMIGGLGKGLSNESEFLARQDEAEAEAARKKDYQGWLLAQQEQYNMRSEGRAEERAIRTEGRADTRAEAQKDRDFARTQAEAPVRRSIKVEDDKASARGKSEVAAETLGTDAHVKSTLAEAGQTSADKRLKGAQADFYGQRGEALDTKMAPADEAEFKAVSTRAGKLQETIDKAMAEPGGWDPANNPGQKQLQSQMAALQLRQRALLQKYRAEPAADPLGMRTGKPPAAGAAPAAPGAPRTIKTGGGMIAQPGDADRAAILTQEYRQAGERLAAAKTDDERRRAQTDLQALERELKAAGVPVPAGGRSVPTQAPTPAPARASAAPAPVAAPVPAAAAPAKNPLMAALNPSGNAALDSVMGARAPAIQEAAQQLAAAQQQVKQAALSKDTQAVTRAVLSVSAAQARLNTLLKDMEPGMAEQVRKAAQQQAGVV